MKEIPIKILKKYNMDNSKLDGALFYETFLIQTDYLAVKLAEGLITKEDKAEEFEARQFARDEINGLSNEAITEKE